MSSVSYLVPFNVDTVREIAGKQVKLDEMDKTQSEVLSEMLSVKTNTVVSEHQTYTLMDSDVSNDEQIRYWETQRKRRVPTDPIIQAFVKPKIDFIQQHVALPSGVRILDVGCGNGYFT